MSLPTKPTRRSAAGSRRSRASAAAARDLLSFPVADGAVEAIADRLVRWLQAPDDLRAAVREALVAVARERYSWEGVAQSVIAAAQGRLDELPEPVG